MDNNCIILSIIMLSAILYIFVVNNSNKEEYMSYRPTKSSNIHCESRRSPYTYLYANMIEKRGTQLRSNGTLCNDDIECASRFCKNNQCAPLCVSKSSGNNLLKLL
jgi:hypothetical protein